MKALLFGIIISFLTPVVLIVTTTQPVMAINPFESACKRANQADLPSYCKESKAVGTKNPITGPGGVLSVVIEILSVVIGIASVFMILISGFRIITSAGDSAKVASGRNGVIYSLVGIVVAVLSTAFVAFVINRSKT